MANWYVRSAATGTASGADWTNAKTTLAAAFSAAAAGDTIFVSEDHAETQSTTMSLSPPGTAAAPNKVLCVNHLGSVPPVSADLRTTAAVSTTGATQIDFSGGYVYVYGITFTAGSGFVSSAFVGLNSAAGTAAGYYFDACVLGSGSTGGSATLTIGGFGSNQRNFLCVLNNTKIKFGSAGQKINIQQATPFVWLNTASAISGTSPTTCFGDTAQGSNSWFVFQGVDFSNVTSNLFAPGSDPIFVNMRDCKLGAAVTVVSGAWGAPGAGRLEMVNCDSGNTNYRYYKSDYFGTEQQETTIVRTGGATDGTTPVSRKLVSGANTNWHWPLDSEWIEYWDNSPGAKTISIPIITDNVTLTNADAWIECEFLGTTGFPLGNFANDATADILAAGSNQPTDTSTWTTTGLVTPVKQLLSASCTTTGKGLIRARVRLAKPSTTLYFDPLILASSSRQFMLGESGYMNEAVQSGGGGGILVTGGMTGGLRG